MYKIIRSIIVGIFVSGLLVLTSCRHSNTEVTAIPYSIDENTITYYTGTHYTYPVELGLKFDFLCSEGDNIYFLMSFEDESTFLACFMVSENLDYHEFAEATDYQNGVEEEYIDLNNSNGLISSSYNPVSKAFILQSTDSEGEYRYQCYSLEGVLRFDVKGYADCPVSNGDGWFFIDGGTAFSIDGPGEIKEVYSEEGRRILSEAEQCDGLKLFARANMTYFVGVSEES